MHSYFDYCQQVLGLREVVWPFRGPDRVQVRLALLTEPAEDSAADSRELLDKMILALKLPAEVVAQESLSLAEIPAEIEWLEGLSAVVVLSETLFQFLSSNYPNMKLFQCPSPQEMLKNPALKRDAWETLKLALKNLEENS